MLLRRLLQSFFLLICCPLALGQPVLEVRFDAGNPPFAVEKQGQAVGYYPRIVEVAAERAGLKLQGQAVPWMRALRALDEGQACAVGAYATPSRRGRYLLSEAVFRDRILVVGLRNRQLPPVRDVEGLKGLRVGMIRGWVYGPLEPHLPSLQRVEATYDDQLFKNLASGRVDVVLAVQYAAQHTMAQLGVDGQVLGELAQADLHLLCPRTPEFRALLDKFDPAVRELRRSGEMARIEAQSLGK